MFLYCRILYKRKEKKWRNNSIMLFRVLGRCFVHFVKDSAVASSPSVIFTDQSNGWLHVRSSTFLVMFYITNYVKYCLYIWCYWNIDVVLWYLYKGFYFIPISFPVNFWTKIMFLYYFSYLYKTFWSTLPAVFPGMFLVFLFFDVRY